MVAERSRLLASCQAVGTPATKHLRILVPLASVTAVGNFKLYTYCKETTAVVLPPPALGAVATT